MIAENEQEIVTDILRSLDVSTSKKTAESGFRQNLLKNCAMMLCVLDGKDPELIVECRRSSEEGDQTQGELVKVPLYATYLAKAEALCKVLSESFETESTLLLLQLNDDYGW